MIFDKDYYRWIWAVIFAAALSLAPLSATFAGIGEKGSGQNTTRQENARGEHKLESITVTAQKQKENVQDVPVSITVFNAQSIEDRKIESVKDIADFVPNLAIIDNGMSGMGTPSMRGLHVAPYTYTTTTGLYLDGVPMITGAGFEEALIDIERVEVLRGPQGTLYGKNTETGVINIISRQPDNEFKGKVSAAGGEDKKQEMSFSLSGPIQQDKVFFGVAGQYYQKDGFIENTDTGDMVDDREHWFGRAHLRWTPVEELDVSLIVSRLKYDEGDANMNLTEQGAAMFGLDAPLERKVTSNLDGCNKAARNAQSLKLVYGLTDSLTLTSVTTNRVYADRAVSDFDFSSATMMHVVDKDNNYEKISQELRLDSSAEQLKWLIGLYYDKDQNDINVVQDSMVPSMVGVKSRSTSGDAYAVFANLTCPLIGQLSLVGGLRYEQQDQEYEDHMSNFKVDDSWDALTPRIGLEYQFSTAIMTYAGASKGYRSGGFNNLTTDPEYYSYDAEELWSYEIGVKSVFFNNRLVLNGAVYYMDISDMQVEEAVGPLTSYMTNAAEATAKGVELEMTAKVMDGMTLMAGVGYNNIEFDQFKDINGDYKGNKNPFAPEYSFNVGVQYRHGSGVYARADLIGYGKTYLDKANEYSRDAHEIVNTKIGYETEKFDIYLYAKNLFDKEYDLVGYYGGMYTIYSDPREIGLQAVYRF
ncbi:TonB-dependent receptor [Desulfobacula phenolica]|uniref:Iron complex outermembrane recepter protein n=1 Tax=Desulfobacula phenolica TaxID=90732 RepID=A0A1H2HC81_9BACT|nr:TonB-dependent receptor [Desulfobacula phenolica]SDU29402.1 iron complex outermembrane recepter protein [Desulfobacula phenolica]